MNVADLIASLERRPAADDAAAVLGCMRNLRPGEFQPTLLRWRLCDFEDDYGSSVCDTTSPRVLAASDCLDAQRTLRRYGITAPGFGDGRYLDELAACAVQADGTTGLGEVPPRTAAEDASLADCAFKALVRSHQRAEE